MRTIVDVDLKDATIVSDINAFRENLCQSVDDAFGNVDPAMNCTEEARFALRRVAETLHNAPDVKLCNLAVIDEIANGIVMEVIRMRLMASGGGTTLDWTHANHVLDGFEAMIDRACRRRMN